MTWISPRRTVAYYGCNGEEYILKNIPQSS